MAHDQFHEPSAGEKPRKTSHWRVLILLVVLLVLLINGESMFVHERAKIFCDEAMLLNNLQEIEAFVMNHKNVDDFRVDHRANDAGKEVWARFYSLLDHAYDCHVMLNEQNEPIGSKITRWEW